MLSLDLFRFNSRLKVLTFAIGICIAFIIGSFAFANGLGSTVQSISGKFESEGLLAYEGDNLRDSVIDLSGLNATGGYASIGLCSIRLNDTDTVFFAVRDPLNILGQNLVPSAGEIQSGKVGTITGQINLSNDNASLTLFANRTYSSSKFPDYWHLMRWSDLEQLRPEMSGRNVSFVMYSTSSDELVSHLRSEGLTVIEMTAILTYFNVGSDEVIKDLWLIILPASFIVTLLVYSAVAMEAKDREREIAILKAMGANNGQIGRIFLFQALMLSMLGGLVGIMLGIIMSYAISTSSSIVITNSLFFLKVTEYSMAIGFLCAVFSGIVGSAYPIYRASKKSVREALTK